MLRLNIVIYLLMLVPTVAMTDAGSLFGGGALSVPRGSVIPIKASVVAMPQPSLFVGRADTGMFAKPPPREILSDRLAYKGIGAADVLRLRHVIGQAESRRDGYDAVQHGARVKPGKRPTAMTLGEIYQWIKDTPGQPHAIGRYQFIPKTLKRVARKVGAKPEQVFSPRLQDRLADVLLAEAGLYRFRKGKLKQEDFMHNLAKIWAGLPTSSGKSYYDGHAGNKASMTWATFEAEMAQITPG